MTQSYRRALNTIECQRRYVVLAAKLLHHSRWILGNEKRAEVARSNIDHILCRGSHLSNVQMCGGNCNNHSYLEHIHKI